MPRETPAALPTFGSLLNQQASISGSVSRVEEVDVLVRLEEADGRRSAFDAEASDAADVL